MGGFRLLKLHKKFLKLWVKLGCSPRHTQIAPTWHLAGQLAGPDFFNTPAVRPLVTLNSQHHGGNSHHRPTSGLNRRHHREAIQSELMMENRIRSGFRLGCIALHKITFDHMRSFASSMPLHSPGDKEGIFPAQLS